MTLPVPLMQADRHLQTWVSTLTARKAQRPRTEGAWQALGVKAHQAGSELHMRSWCPPLAGPSAQVDPPHGGAWPPPLHKVSRRCAQYLRK